jgi:hypothetical protein
MAMIDERIEALRVNIESLHSSVSELYAIAVKDGESIRELSALASKDGENIRALARVAELHERPPTDLEGGSDTR